MTLRIEKVQKPDPATIVKTAKVVKLSDLAAVLPADVVRVTPAERGAGGGTVRRFHQAAG